MSQKLQASIIITILSVILINIAILANAQQVFHAWARDGVIDVVGAKSNAIVRILSLYPTQNNGIATQVGLYYYDPGRQDSIWFLIGFIRHIRNGNLGPFNLYGEYKFWGKDASYAFTNPGNMSTYYELEVILFIGYTANYAKFRVNGDTMASIPLPNPEYLEYEYIAIVHAESESENNWLKVDYTSLRHTRTPEGMGSIPNWVAWVDPVRLGADDNLYVIIISDDYIRITQNLW